MSAPTWRPASACARKRPCRLRHRAILADGAWPGPDPCACSCPSSLWQAWPYDAAMSDSLALERDARAFLGVERSFLGRAWRERLGPEALSLALAICQTHALPDILGRVMAGRGIGVNQVPVFLQPKLRDLLPDPS